MKAIFKDAARNLFEACVRTYLGGRPRRPYRSSDVKRILVFAYHGIGNFIMYTPALKLLRENFPNARIDLQVGNKTGCEEVITNAHIFDNIYNVPYDAGPLAWLARIREVRATNYDLTVSEFHSHSWPLALLVAASRAPFRLGHVTSPGWDKRFSRYGYVFNLPVEMREDEHEIERYLDLIARLGVTPPDYRHARTFVHLAEEDREFAHSFLASTASQGEGSLIGFQPGTSATMRWKQWPLDRYREVIARLSSECPDAQILLFGSDSERPMIEQLARGLGPRVAIAAGKTTLKQVAALIEACDLLVCNDSGLMHVAVAVGTPVVAIYGPTDINRTAPLGDRNVVIRHELPCSPCFKMDGDDRVRACPHHDCLMTITPDELLHTITLSSRQGRTRLSVARPDL